ncbi:MAG: DMT family transporter [Proteobacteria bacterium]|nr:DMT family transporter [Pseudomonadota bacterium]
MNAPPQPGETQDAVSGRAPSLFAKSLNAPRGIAFMVASGAFVTINDAMVKLVTQSMPVGEILFFRAVIALIGMLILFKPLGGVHGLLLVNDRVGLGLRVSTVMASNVLFVSSVKYLPLPDVVAIVFAGPLFMTLLAIPFLGERVSWRRGLATVVGFSGVLLMVRPTGDVFNWVTLLPVCNAMIGAVRDILTRRISLTESSMAMLFYATIGVALIGLVTLPFGWVWPTWPQLGLLVICAAGLAISQYMMIEAFRWTEATLVAPFRYTTLAWAVFAGWLMWDYLPSPMMLAGFAVVAASGLYIWRRESRHK